MKSLCKLQDTRLALCGHRFRAEILSVYLRANLYIVVIKLKGLTMFRREYEKLIPAGYYRLIQEQINETIEYVYRLLKDEANPDNFAMEADNLLHITATASNKRLVREVYNGCSRDS